MGPKNQQQQQQQKAIKSTERKSAKAPKRAQRSGTQLPSVSSVVESESSIIVPLDLQQAILNVFRSAFPLAANPDQISSTTQEVKGHLYNRDFAQAFGRPDYLNVYALRWSATRALAYADIFAALNLLQRQDVSTEQSLYTADNHAAVSKTFPSPSTASKVLSIGGGAGAELVAFAALARLHGLASLSFVALDIANWSNNLDQLYTSLITPPPLSPYASAAAKASNRPFLDAADQLRIHFLQRDILHVGEDGLRELLRHVKLVTLMFTLNELFTASIARTTAFLLALTDAVEPETWLLVVDTPGSYAEVQLGGAEDDEGNDDDDDDHAVNHQQQQQQHTAQKKKKKTKKTYPMKWLLHHTLLNLAVADQTGSSKQVGEEEEEEEEAAAVVAAEEKSRGKFVTKNPADGGKKREKWRVHLTDDSRWYRINPALKYPIPLENMRHQIHVFQRV